MANVTQMEATKVGFLKALVEEYSYYAVVHQLRLLAEAEREEEVNNELQRCAWELFQIEEIGHQ